jgi:hypothetical protein
VVCEANGITEEDVCSKADQVEHLEMFLFNFPRMLSLGLFANLSSLSIMQQNIQTLEGLDGCVHLKTLWVIESQVRCVQHGGGAHPRGLGTKRERERVRERAERRKKTNQDNETEGRAVVVVGRVKRDTLPARRESRRRASTAYAHPKGERKTNTHTCTHTHKHTNTTDKTPKIHTTPHSPRLPPPPLSSQITKIQGLHNCTKLERLHLYSNRIERIENLENLSALQVLWLADNKITHVENLGALTSLREINLARNCIETVGDVLLARVGMYA